jgi:hypothetical protein
LNQDIKRAISSAELILFLGAGASRNCSDQNGQPLLDGNGLAERLAADAGLPFDGEPLDLVYSAAKQKLQSRLDKILEQLFQFCSPSPEYATLATYAWRRIYTLNIDDALERAFARKPRQNVSIHIGSDPLKERDPVFRRLDYIKMNGCISRLRDGLVFSQAEYAQSANSPQPWYQESAADFLRSPFLFVGTKLDEPLFKFHIERYKQCSKANPGMSYVITPSATEIQRLDLKAYNIEHIPGTLADFATWLRQTFPDGIESLDLAKASLPLLAEMIGAKDQAKYASLFADVIHVKRSTLRARYAASDGGGAILPFYKGFKPSWSDIVQEVPAQLDALPKFLEFLQENRRSGVLVPLIGPAGSGKTTLLMQAAYRASEWAATEVFFIGEPVRDLVQIAETLDAREAASSVLIFIDKIGFLSDQLADLLKPGRLTRTTIVGAERQHIWHSRVEHRLAKSSTRSFSASEFSKADAQRLLEQLERYGSWTRLGQLPKERRTYELVSRSQRQLLIALLEATSGRGFEQIIENDYDSLTSDAERMCFILVGLATIQRSLMPVALVNRALVQLGLAGHVSALWPALSGIIISREGRLSARHELYVRHLFERHVDPSLISRAIGGLLQAFALNQAPVIANIPKSEATIYKGSINHRFLYNVLRGKSNLVLGVYRSLEKRFERDGLFWLQYGLSLRDFELHDGALEKFRIAAEAYRMDHTEHALAQQLLIVAERNPTAPYVPAYLDEAKQILARLDRTIRESDDEYPIVTLAEGHTRVVRQLEGESAARSLAGQYANLVKVRLDEAPDKGRLRACWESLMRYASVGTWSATQGAEAADFE